MTDVGWPSQAAAARSRARRLRSRATTTPGRLRLGMAAIVLALLVAALVLSAVTAARQDATSAVATRDEPLMVEADRLYGSLADADATAATTFLRGGTEPADLRARYLADLRRAGAQLAGLGRRVEGAAEGAAVAAIGAALPVYSGLVETARANNRQGFPVGAAYLRRASDLMRGRILPAAGRLYAAESERLGDHQRAGTGSGGLALALAGCALALAVLVGVQVLLARRMRRVFNVPLVAATVVVVGLAVWVAVALGSSREALARSQRDGSDAVQVLSAARIVSLRAQADESLALVARGGGDRYVADFAVVHDLLAPPGGLLGTVSRLAAPAGTAAAVDDLAATWRRIRAEHARVARLERAGRFGDAVRRAVGAGSREAALSDRLNTGFGTVVAAAQRRFEAEADRARSALRGLAVGIPLLLFAAGALALAGVQARVNEYR